MRLSEKIANSLCPLGGQTILNFWRLHYDLVSNPNEFFPFFAGTNGPDNPIIFGGVAYAPIPCEIDPIEVNSFGRLSRPQIRISNENNQISDLLRRKNDFKNAKFVRIKTFLKFIDDVNFDSGQNPYGIPDPTAELSRESFIVSQKLGENKREVSFELSVPFDLQSQTTPSRVVLSRYCSFQYRGKGCNYCGKPVAKNDDSGFSIDFDGSYEISSAKNLWTENTNYFAGNAVYVENISDPPRTVFVCIKDHLSDILNSPNQAGGVEFWEKDDCSKTIPGCKTRFVNDPTSVAHLGYLRGSFFPAVDNYRLGG